MEYDDYMEGELFEEDFAENDQLEQSESIPTEEHDESDALKSVWKKTEGSKSKQAKPSTSRTARPKLSEKELISSKGLPALKELFENYKCPENMDPYKSLNQILTKMEYWAHGLYPKFNFEDFLDRVEVIGHKRLVRTSLYRLRVGLPLDEIHIGGKDDEKEGNSDDDDQLYGEKTTAEKMFDEQFKKGTTTKDIVDVDEMDIEAASALKPSAEYDKKEYSVKKKPITDREEESDDEVISATSREGKENELKIPQKPDENNITTGNFTGDFNQDYWSDDSN